MGALSFVHEITATSAKEAFEILCAEATYEHGNDPYNGTINTCYLGRQTLSFDRPTEKRIADAYKHADTKLADTEKYSANYIDLGVESYEVTTFKKKSITDSAPKYKLGFVVYDPYGDFRDKQIFDTKTLAMGRALELSVKHGKNLHVKKEYSLVSGVAEVGAIESETKSYKSMPKLKPAPNRVVKPMHRYVFYGWAGY